MKKKLDNLISMARFSYQNSTILLVFIQLNISF